MFEWELAGAALECYAQVIGPRCALTAPGAGAHSYARPAPDTPTTPTHPATTLGGRLSEKGVLQLLADVRFLRDVLAGGRPLNPRTAAVATAGSGGGAGAGAAPAPPPPPALLVDPQDQGSLAALAERKRMGVALEQQLQVGVGAGRMCVCVGELCVRQAVSVCVCVAALHGSGRSASCCV